MYYDNL